MFWEFPFSHRQVNNLNNTTLTYSMCVVGRHLYCICLQVLDLKTGVETLTLVLFQCFFVVNDQVRLFILYIK